LVYKDFGFFLFQKIYKVLFLSKFIGDVVCSIKGLLDIMAGILVLVSLGVNLWAIAFAILMV